MLTEERKWLKTTYSILCDFNKAETKETNTCLAKHLGEVQLLLKSKETSNQISSVLAISGRDTG